jgi:hypothetical protein
VLPLVQCCGVGQLIMKAYLDQMINAGVVDSVALICQEVSDLPYLPRWWRRWWW